MPSIWRRRSGGLWKRYLIRCSFIKCSLASSHVNCKLQEIINSFFQKAKTTLGIYASVFNQVFAKCRKFQLFKLHFELSL